jgi:signal transduction histidine kinase
MVESLERGTIEPGERRREYLRVIGQECRRLSSLVENLLDFSRIDRGRREYLFEPADLPALIVQTADAMRPYATRQRVNLVCQTSPAAANLTSVSVDRGALQQALVNLADNAIKHAPAGSDVLVGLDVIDDRASESVPGPWRIRLFVTDHGPGIPAGEQERIFEPFYRRGSELRRETQGVGLGLSIVKHVAEAHGGRVSVANSSGSGCTFAIELPMPTEPAS